MSEFKSKKSNVKALWSKSKVEMSKVLGIGKKMFSAGKINAEIKDTLSQLGLVVYQQQKSSQQKPDNQEIKSLIDKVDYLSKLMDNHEGEIQRLKNKVQLS